MEYLTVLLYNVKGVVPLMVLLVLAYSGTAVGETADGNYTTAMTVMNTEPSTEPSTTTSSESTHKTTTIMETPTMTRIQTTLMTVSTTSATLKLGIPCTGKKPCEHISNATCNEHCICRQGFYSFPSDNICYQDPIIKVSDQLMSAAERNVYCSDLTSSCEVCLMWDICLHSNEPLPNSTHFNVTYNGKTENITKFQMQENGMCLTFAGRVGNLTSGVKHNFMVQAISDFWTVGPVKSPDYWTAPTSPTILDDAPNATSVTLHVQNTSATKNYYVTACTHLLNQSACTGKQFDVLENIKLEKLIPGRQYSVEVMAVVHGINSTVSSRTDIHTVPQLKNMKLHEMESDLTGQAVVQWSIPTDSLPDGFNLTYSSSRLQINEGPIFVPFTNQTEYEKNLADLSPGFTYTVVVTAFLNSATSQMNKTYTTYPKAPSFGEISIVNEREVSFPLRKAMNTWADGYIITYCCLDNVGKNKSCHSHNKTTEGNPNTTDVNLTDLSPFQTCNMSVSSWVLDPHGSVKDSPDSSWLFVNLAANLTVSSVSWNATVESPPCGTLDPEHEVCLILHVSHPVTSEALLSVSCQLGVENSSSHTQPFSYMRLTGLRSGLGYTCNMTATVDNWNTTSQPFSFVTYPTAPTFVDYTAEENTVTLMVNKLSDSSANEVYDISYCDGSSACTEKKGESSMENNSRVTIRVPGLQPSKTYSIYLKSRVTVNDLSVSSIGSINTTVFTAPSKPNSAELSLEVGQNLEARWNSTGSQNYRLRYGIQNNGSVTAKNISCTPICSYKLKSWIHGGVYNFTVLAFNGPWNKSSESVLYALAPMNPSIGHIVNVTQESFQLEWTSGEGFTDVFIIHNGTGNISIPTAGQTNMTQHVMGLNPGVEYIFVITAGIDFNNMVKLDTTTEPLKLSNYTKPAQPFGEVITELKYDSVSFTFTNSSPADSFNVDIRPKDNDTKIGEVTYSDQYQSLGICGLVDPGRLYNVSITAQAGVWYSLPYSFTFYANETSPGAPVNLSIVSVNSSAIGIRWDRPSKPNGKILSYMINYWTRASPSTDKWDIAGSNSTQACHMTVTQLSPGHCYRLSVKAVNGAGQRESADLYITTDQTVPAASLVSARAARLNGWHDIQVNWSAPVEQNGVVVNYTIQVNNSSSGQVQTLCFVCCDCPSLNDTCRGKLSQRRKRQKGCPSEQVEKPSGCEGFTYDTTLFTATISNLHPYAHYTVTLTACTPAGCSHNRTGVDTQQDAPSAPQNVVATADSSTSVQLTWSLPEEINGIIQYYTVHYNGSSRNTMTNQTDIVIDVLDKWTVYIFTVQGVTVKPGSPSEAVSCHTLEDVPSSRPQNVSAKAHNSSVIELLWLPPSEANGVIQSYQIMVYLSDILVNLTTPGTVTMYHVTGLDYWTFYSFTVTAVTMPGAGPPSSCVTARTKEHAPTSEPVDFVAEMINETSICLSWDPPIQSNGLITQYEITHRELEGKKNTSLMSDGKNNTLVVSDLKYWTTYEFTITASTMEGTGPMATALERTDQYVPTSPVLQVEAVDKTATRIELQWSVPLQPNGVVLHYSIKYNSTEHVHGSSLTVETTINTTNNKTRHELTSLDYYWMYTVIILAYTVKGAGLPPSTPCQIWTAQWVPGKPVNVSSQAVNETAISLSWKCPDFPNGVILGYTVTYNHTKSLVFVGDQMAAVIGGLGVWTVYQFFVHANTSIGAGDGSNVTQRTKEAAPVRPTESADGSLIDVAVNVHVDRQRQAAISLAVEFFQDDSRGVITSRGIIVIEAALLNKTVERIVYGGQTRTVDDISQNFVTWKQYYEKGVKKPYRATSDHWEPTIPGSSSGARQRRSIKVNYILGKDGDCQSQNLSSVKYCNGYLKPGTQYRVKVFVCNKGGCTDTYYSKPISTDPIPTSVAPAIAGAVVGVVLALCAIAAVLYMKRSRRGPFAMKEDSSGQEIEVTPDTGTELELVARINRPIDLTDLESTVSKMKRSSNLQFAEEYKELRDLSSRLSHHASELEVNRPKNRYTNILPFDQSRVKLLPLDDDEGSDYINASYIPGYSSRREYIASQGPLPATKDDFWRMIWEQNVSLIVMVTKCVEGRGRIKCERYWPFDQEPIYFGEIIVQTRSESILPEYDIRILDIRLSETMHTVKHYNMKTWPDFGCPGSPTSLLNFLSMIRKEITPSMQSPILVHCSAGVGRTGTYIAVDCLLQQMRDDSYVDIFAKVLEMREHRPNMVQTEDQYIYIHDCAVDAYKTLQLGQGQENSTFQEEENIYENSVIGV